MDYAFAAETGEPSEEPLTFSDRPSGISCPRCDGDAFFANLFGIKVVGCPTCLGFLARGGEFGELVVKLRREYQGPRRLPQPLDVTQLDRSCHCAVCGEPMETHPYAGPGAVVIDFCRHCELVWLDRGELLQIQQAPGRT